MSEQRAISADEFRRLFARKPGTLGGPVDDGDSMHPQHSRLVGEVGTWLNTQPGVLVWATYTGRPTGKGTKGTPGVPDLNGWALQAVSIEASGRLPSWVHLVPIDVPIPLYVECKVGRDDLSEAQREFKRLAEAAGCLYFVAEWDGEGADPAAGLPVVGNVPVGTPLFPREEEQ